jgi:DNA (cytosine-5)-methyltransferase 1
MLSDQDLLELQTFPKDWYLYGTRMERAFQIGNAVPPTLAMAVGKSIIEACSADKRVEKKSHFEESIACQL